MSVKKTFDFYFFVSCVHHWPRKWRCFTLTFMGRYVRYPQGVMIAFFVLFLCVLASMNMTSASPSLYASVSFFFFFSVLLRNIQFPFFYFFISFLAVFCSVLQVCYLM